MLKIKKMLFISIIILCISIFGYYIYLKISSSSNNECSACEARIKLETLKGNPITTSACLHECGQPGF